MTSRRSRKRLLRRSGTIVGTIIILLLLFRILTSVRPPVAKNELPPVPERVEAGSNAWTCQDSWLKKNSYGLWEMYLNGSDFELGVKNGVLASELIKYQEEVFVERLREMVPSDFYINFLKQVVIWMNRNLNRHIPPEYQREIYGVALQASESYDFIGPAYPRILSYHAAHDLGHALQNMNLVACTALGVNGARSMGGELLVGRNFDFSMGDKFARDKIVAFYNPDKGHKFAFITWGGMIGAVSGMNDQGLVVTLNAAKSGIPRSSKTPVSILARQILQYAANIEEAYAIAGKSETFVAESFLISSARDNLTVVIEKSPHKMALYDPPAADHMVLTNHFQSETFRDSELTVKNKAEGASLYRWERTLELIEATEKHDEHSFALILRDQDGMGGEPIGMGNEKAVNQLIAHHSLIFKPSELKMWVSSSPYQLGAYLCYDLNRVFADSTEVSDRIWEENETISSDPFLESEDFEAFRAYSRETVRLKALIDREEVGGIKDEETEAYLSLNPHNYYPWFIAGEISRLQGDRARAAELYEQSLSREIPRLVDQEQVEEAMELLKNE
jgi:isopenicillin-N N-acyltransferase like protein